VKSNLAISEELSRLSSYLNENKSAGSCQNPECPNYGTSIRLGTLHYYPHGKTKSGSLRFKCKVCKRVFSVGVSTLRQKKHHKNILVFSLLMNKMPFTRICEVAGIEHPALYHKIDFLHRQCLAFAASRERRLAEGDISKWSLYIGVDRQDYMVNWKAADDKRNIVLSSIASAENATGYVFGIHLNFDPSIDPMETEDETLDLNDYEIPSPFRRHARVWLGMDYPQSENERYSRRRGPREAPDEPTEEMDKETTRLPYKGMQVHTDYTMYGHFFFLKKLFGKSVTKTRFYLDRDSGMKGACIAAFADEIQGDRCHAFCVKIKKGLSYPKKLRLINESLDELDDFMGRPRKGKKDKSGKPIKQDSTRFRSSPLIESDRAWYRQATLEKIKADMRTIRSDMPEGRRWLKHPQPNMGEPEKEILHITNTDRIQERELIWLYYRASLHSVDNFFQQVRRRLSHGEADRFGQQHGA
jgi:transposase-like protein